MFKKAFINKIAKLVIIVLAAILLVILIRNGWDIKAAFSSFTGLFRR